MYPVEPVRFYGDEGACRAKLLVKGLVPGSGRVDRVSPEAFVGLRNPKVPLIVLD